MAKKSVRDGGGASRGMNTKGKTVGFTAPKGMPQLKSVGKPTEAITAKGAKAKNLGKSTKENRFASNAKTPVKKAGSGFAGSGGTTASGFKNITKGDIAKAAILATGMGAAQGFKLVTRQVVSEGTKKLQRELSKELRSSSDKDIRSMPKAKREEVAYKRFEDRVQSEADFRSGSMRQQELRKDIAESMKKTTKTQKVLKKKLK